MNKYVLERNAIDFNLPLLITHTVIL